MNLHVLESQIRGLRRTADDLLAQFDRTIQPNAGRATLTRRWGIVMTVNEEVETKTEDTATDP